jgi:hypothetical protein
MRQEVVTRSVCLPELVRRELVLERWRSGQPTSEIARVYGMDEACVCRIIEESGCLVARQERGRQA